MNNSRPFSITNCVIFVALSLSLVPVEAVAQRNSDNETASMIRELGVVYEEEIEDEKNLNRVFAKLCKKGPVVIPHLIEAIKKPALFDSDRDRHVDIQMRAIWALQRCFPPIRKEAVPALTVAVSHKDKRLIGVAAGALSGLGPAAKDAVPALIGVLRNLEAGSFPSCGYCVSVVIALANVGISALPDLLQALNDDKVEVRLGAAHAIGRIGPEAKRAVPDLIKALKNPEVVRAAVQALGSIGPASRDAVPILVQYVGDLTDARTALAAIGVEAVPALIQSLDAPRAKVREGAAEALRQMGPVANDAVPILLRHLSDSDADVRYSAAFALGNVARPNNEIIQALISLLRDSDRIARIGAAKGLATFGSAAKEAIPFLITELPNEDSLTAAWCETALVEIGIASIPNLILALNSDDPQTRIHAANALGELAFPASEGISVLKKHLNDTDPGVREATRNAISKIEQRPK